MRVHDGSRVSVFWPEERQYFVATVSNYCAKNGKYTLDYDDGQVDCVQLDGPAAVTFSILTNSCSCCGGAALRDPGPVSCCIVPDGFAAVTAGAFSVPCQGCKRSFCARCLPGPKPAGCEVGHPTRFMAFRKQLLCDDRKWFCPQSSCKQVRKADSGEAKVHAAEAQAKAAADKAEEKQKKEAAAAAAAEKKAEDKLANLSKSTAKKNCDYVMRVWRKIDKKQKAEANEKEDRDLEDSAVVRSVSLAAAKHGALPAPPAGITVDQQVGVIVGASKHTALSGVRQRRTKKSQVAIKVPVYMPHEAWPSAFEQLPRPRLIGSGHKLKLRWSGKPADFDKFFGVADDDVPVGSLPSWRAPISVSAGHDLLCPREKDTFTVTFSPGNQEVVLLGQHRFAA
jgi:hypothetical protein